MLQLVLFKEMDLYGVITFQDYSYGDQYKLSTSGFQILLYNIMASPSRVLLSRQDSFPQSAGCKYLISNVKDIGYNHA